MPEYVANSILAHRGKAVFPGQKVTLSAEQAEALGTKVVPVNVADPSKPITDMTVKELKELAKAAHIEGYSTMTKPELLAALDAATPEAVVNGDGSGSD